MTRKREDISIGVHRQRFLRRRLEAAITHQPEIRSLRDLLLRIGGCELVAPAWADSRIRALFSIGYIMEAKVRLMPMEPCACHRNVSRLWRRKQSRLIGIGTGYALSADGLWRQHSWAVTSRRILETTELRSIYFGQLLNGSSADEIRRV